MTGLTGSPATALDTLPNEALVPVWWVREQIAGRGVRPQVVSVSQAHASWPAYSRETWRLAAGSGEIRGAWRDNPRGPWRLPLASCEQYVAERQQQGRRRNKTGPRGPRSWYEEKGP